MTWPQEQGIMQGHCSLVGLWPLPFPESLRQKFPNFVQKIWVTLGCKIFGLGWKVLSCLAWSKFQPNLASQKTGFHGNKAKITLFMKKKFENWWFRKFQFFEWAISCLTYFEWKTKSDLWTESVNFWHSRSATALKKSMSLTNVGHFFWLTVAMSSWQSNFSSD